MRTVEISGFTCPLCGEESTAIMSEESGVFCNACRQALPLESILPRLADLTPDGQRAALDILAGLGKPGVGGVTMPLGFLAGRVIPLGLALENMAQELLGHGADLEESAQRAELRPGDYSQSAETMKARAADLRRYGWALWLICRQIDSRAPDMPGLAGQLQELAQEWRLSLPAGWGSL